MKVAALLLGLCAYAVQGAVIGIDFGGRFMKVGIIQPGTGIDIVLNEATKRKSSSAVAFNKDDERILGDDANNLAGKIPERVFQYVKLMLAKGVKSEDIQSLISQGYPYSFAEDEDTGAAYIKHTTKEGDTQFYVEELVAFILTYAKKISEAHSGTTVRDCVITVPAQWSHLERQAMLNAAQIAGLNVLSLMNDNLAVAFKYGFDKEGDFAAEPRNVLFYDLGSSQLTTSLVNFAAKVGKKNKTTGELTMKAVAWDTTVGGRIFDQRVVDILAENFDALPIRKGQPSIRESKRAMGKLRKEAERIKEVLSANTKFAVGIEALHDDIDFKMVIEREDFEKRCGDDMWDKFTVPIQSVLDQANLTKEDIHSVEIVGGAVRTPRVKESIKKFLGREDLAQSLNGDEAMALGATLYSAKLSTSFRLREFGITDAFPYGIGVRLEGSVDPSADDDAAEDSGKKDKSLFKKNSKFPHKKLITLSRSEDVSMSLAYREPVPVGHVAAIANYNISGVAAGLESLSSDKNRPTSKPKVSITFGLNTHGLAEISKAEVMLEVMEKYNTTIQVPINDTTEEANATEANATEAAEEEPVPAAEYDSVEANASNASNASKKNATKAPPKPKFRNEVVEKERKRVHHVPLYPQVEVLGNTKVMNGTIIQKCIDHNLELLKQEEVRRKNAEAKNALESYIIDTRDKLYSQEGIDEVSTDEEKGAISAAFEKMEDWLYEEGMDMGAKEYKAKKKEMTKLADPIFIRLEEMTQRPKIVAQAREAINWTENLLVTWSTERPEVTEEERNRTQEMCTNFTVWMDDLEAQQAEKPKHEDPVFTSNQVLDKLEPIEKEMRRLIKKPKPKPKLAKKPKANATNTTDGNATAANTTTENATEAAANSTIDGDELPVHDEL